MNKFFKSVSNDRCVKYNKETNKLELYWMNDKMLKIIYEFDEQNSISIVEEQIVNGFFIECSEVEFQNFKSSTMQKLNETN